MTMNFSPTKLQKTVIQVLRNMIAAPDGSVPPEFQGAFSHVNLDAEGYPYIQGLTSFIAFDKTDPLHISFSPLLGAEPGQTCIELSNICDAVAPLGTRVMIAAPHYIDPKTLALVTGPAAFDAFRHDLRMQVLEDLRKLKADQDAAAAENAPKILVPNKDIILK